MYGIRVFLAGSTKQGAQRNSIRCLLSRLQNKLKGPEQEPIALHVYDYKDFESRQKEYDEFIQNETDIFIALVEAKYDTKEHIEAEDCKGTYHEFKLACEAFIEKRKPEVILLYNTSKGPKKPSKRWKTELDRIDKYALADTSFGKLSNRLATEIEKTICKWLPNTPKPEKATAAKYQIGDVYECNGVKGIVFSIDPSGQSGKIISIRPSIICSWKDFQKKKAPFTSPWRAPEMQELEEIFLNKDTFKTVSDTMKQLKGAANLEHDRYREAYLSSTPHKAFRQKIVRWSCSQQCFNAGDCETSYVGIIRPIAKVDF